jgi:hypothetical protein
MLPLLAGCPRTESPAAAQDAIVVPAGPPLFDEVAKAAGIDFTYRNGEEAGHFAILESQGGGVALLDYDGDGLLDIYVSGGGHYDTTEAEWKKNPDKPPRILGYPGKLYKNLGNWKFRDVTEEAGLGGALFYTHGCAVADYDRDGWPDLLVTGWGRVALFHNEPVDPKDPKRGRHFVDVTDKVGLHTGGWTTSAAWGDLDGDGWPDLYVCHYADWSFRDAEHHPRCTYDNKTRDVCPPKSFTALPHQLFRNRAGKSFDDISKPAGLRVPRDPGDYEELTHLSDAAKVSLKQSDRDRQYGKGLGVLMVDVNGDGKPDIYVANDTVDKFLYMNRSAVGRLCLEDIAQPAGVALDDRGTANGSMGLDAADYDGCGRPSLWVTNYENELHALYRNECVNGREFFTYQTRTVGLAALGRSNVAWGTGFLDLDHDGWPDLFIATGHAIRFPTGAAARCQRPFLLRNHPDPRDARRRRFVDWSSRGGAYFKVPHCARGVAFGDLDNDGRVDLVISHLNEPVAILRNIVPPEGRHWLGLRLVGKDHRDVVGARIEVTVGGRKLVHFARGGGSYASANDPRHIVGLGEAERVERVTVSWPWGQQQHWDNLAADRYHDLVEQPARPE